MPVKIPNLPAVTNVAGTALIPIDSGIETYRITRNNLFKSSQVTLTGSGSWTVPAGVIGVMVMPRFTTSLFINAGDAKSAVIKGTVMQMFGLNGQGQLGLGDIANRSTPVQVVGSTQFTKVSARGEFHTLAIDASGNAWAWGNNSSGRLGDLTIAHKSTPVQVVGGHIFVDVTAGAGYSFGRKSNGQVWSWGDNTFGQLGHLNTTAKSSPVQVVGGHVFDKVVCTLGGSPGAAGLKSDGSVWCWGSGSSGILGNGTTNTVSSPVQVTGGHIFVDIEAGSSFFIARKADGSIWGWGSNGDGQLGQNDIANRSTPVQVIGGHQFQKMGASNFGWAALDMSGGVWICGDGFYQPSDYSSPIQISPSNFFTDITVGDEHILAKKSDGSLWSWGAGTQGQLGDGATTLTTTPGQRRVSDRVPSDVFFVPTTPSGTITYSTLGFDSVSWPSASTSIILKLLF